MGIFVRITENSPDFTRLILMINESRIDNPHTDEETFRHLFERYYQPLCAFGCKYVNDHDQVSDIVQEAFIRLMDRRNRFEHLLQIKSYLYTVVRNRCIDSLRRRRAVGIDTLSSDAFFEESVVEVEMLDLFTLAVSSLPDQMRTIIEKSLQGIKNAEIASQMNIGPETVHSLKKIAYKKLRVKLQEYYYLLSLLHII